MSCRRIAIAALVAAGLALPLSSARAQLYYPCSPWVLEFPVCASYDALSIVGMVVATPFAIVYSHYDPKPEFAYPPPPADIAPPVTYGGPYYYPRRR
ncbi:MAG TPA: hypothetical protein VJR70_11815 [Stellaceae bacterium]|nr:hypothetical protein [Stellaceae bacterium]